MHVVQRLIHDSLSQEQIKIEMVYLDALMRSGLERLNIQWQRTLCEHLTNSVCFNWTFSILRMKICKKKKKKYESLLDFFICFFL